MLVSAVVRHASTREGIKVLPSAPTHSERSRNAVGHNGRPAAWSSFVYCALDEMVSLKSAEGYTVVPRISRARRAAKNAEYQAKDICVLYEMMTTTSAFVAKSCSTVCGLHLKCGGGPHHLPTGGSDCMPFHWTCAMRRRGRVRMRRAGPELRRRRGPS